MQYSTLIVQKAQDAYIDLNDPVGILRICKLLLEGLWWKFGGDLRKVVGDMDGLELELREIRNALVSTQINQIALSFVNAGYIVSMELIMQGVNEAYGLICSASMALEHGGHTAEVYNGVFRNFTSCQDEIGKALQGFRIS